MIESLAWKTANHIKNNAPEHKVTVEELNYALIVLFNFIFVVLLVLVINLFTGKIDTTVLLLAHFAILRQISGGFHLESSDWCAIATAFVASALAFVNINDILILGLTALSIIVLVCLAPIGVENQTIIPPKYFTYLKWASVLLATSNFFFQSDAAAISYFAQSLLLILYYMREVRKR